MTNTRYINDMIIRYYNLCRAIRTVTEDMQGFSEDAKLEAITSLTRERDQLKNMLDEDLAGSVSSIRSDFSIRP